MLSSGQLNYLGLCSIDYYFNSIVVDCYLLKLLRRDITWYVICLSSTIISILLNLHLSTLYVDILLYLEYARLELCVLSFPVYRDLFHCDLAFSIAFLFLAFSVCFTANSEMFWNVSDGCSDKAFFQAFGPQSGPSIHLKPALAQWACHDPP